MLAWRLRSARLELGAAWLAAELNDHVIFQSKLPESEIDNLAAVLTEQRNPRSENLEELSPRALVELFVEEEKSVQDALRGAHYRSCASH